MDSTSPPPSPPPSAEKQWYVVHTYSGYENAVKRGLEERIRASGIGDLFFEILVPSEEVTERRGKTTIKTARKFFPGYIFVQMMLTQASWHLVKNTPKVTGFLGGNTPRPVREAEMNRMLGHSKAAEERAPAAREPLPAVSYKLGQAVRVKSGAFANFTGEVEELNDDKRKIWLSVSIFGRPTRVEVDFSEVEAAS